MLQGSRPTLRAIFFRWITAGIRLSRVDFVPKAYEYVDVHWYNSKARAGVVQAPIDGKYENCIFTSAHLGFTMLHVGQSEKAKAQLAESGA